MKKLISFEKQLISEGLIQMKSLFEADIQRLKDEGKVPLFSDNFIPSTIESINSKLGLFTRDY